MLRSETAVCRVNTAKQPGLLPARALFEIISSGQSRLGYSGSQSSHARSGGEAFTAWPNKSAERPRGPSQLSLFKDPSELSTQVIQHFGVRPALAAPYMDSCVILVMVSKQHPHSKPRATGSAATRKSRWISSWVCHRAGQLQEQRQRPAECRERR